MDIGKVPECNVALYKPVTLNEVKDLWDNECDGLGGCISMKVIALEDELLRQGTEALAKSYWYFY